MAPALDQLALATAVPHHHPSLEGYTFDGYRNADGSVGTKNILGITTTVQCVAPTVDYAVRRIKAELLPRFTNVDDVVSITHTYGCGVAIDAPGATIPIRTLGHISHHANSPPAMRKSRTIPALPTGLRVRGAARSGSPIGKRA